MALLKFGPFGGIFPRTGTRLLQTNTAQIAQNFKLQSGELRPMSGTGVLAPALGSPKTGTPLSIFRARSGTTAAQWFTWPFDVDCVRVPLSTDVESRFCWTGDGAPKYITYTNAVSSGTNNYPLAANELQLGVPAPIVAPVLATVGGVGTAVTRFYCYTFQTALGEESAPSPFSLIKTGPVDASWNITAMDVAPLNAGVINAGLVETPPGFIRLTTTLPHWLRAGDSVVVAAVGGITDANGTWTVATVPTTSQFTIAKVSAQVYTAGGTWTRSTPWNTTLMTKNIYRTSGSTGSFQMVVAGIAAATTTYSDTIVDSLMVGSSLISQGWLPPPVGLRGLTVHPSGALVGFVNNLMCFSEPYQPHAWPAAYQLASAYNGVGLACYGTNVVMGTLGPPFVASGVAPATMSGEDVQGTYPCLAKRSVISIGDAVIYSTKYGLVAVGANGVAIFTDRFYTRDEWVALNPSTMFCEKANDRVYVGYTNSSSINQVLVFDNDIHTTVTVQPSELYTDPSTGELYVGTTLGISLWDDPAQVVLTGDWRSKEEVIAVPANMGAAKVDFVLAIDPAIAAANAAAIVAATLANTTALAAATVTMTIANPCVVSWAGTTLQVNDRVVFQTTGALPNGGVNNVVAGTSYFVLAAGFSAGVSFRISLTSGGAAINTLGGAQSGVHTSISARQAGGSINSVMMNEHAVNGSNLTFVPTSVASNNVTFNLYSGTQLLASRVITDTRAFRLPAGYKKDAYNVEIITQCQIKEVRVAETMDEMRKA